jgi:hypothetical protein
MHFSVIGRTIAIFGLLTAAAIVLVSGAKAEATKATARLRGLPSPGVINPLMSADGTPATAELDVWSPILFAGSKRFLTATLLHQGCVTREQTSHDLVSTKSKPVANLFYSPN